MNVRDALDIGQFLASNTWLLPILVSLLILWYFFGRLLPSLYEKTLKFFEEKVMPQFFAFMSEKTTTVMESMERMEASHREERERNNKLLDRYADAIENLNRNFDKHIYAEALQKFKN